VTGRWAALGALGLSLGLDSLRAGVALGALRRARRWRTPLAFGLADAAAALLGAVAGAHVVAASSRLAGWLAAAVLAGYGLAALAGRGDGEEPGRGLGVALPVALSADNLVAGLGLGVLGVPVPLAVVALGASSAAMAAAGVALGHRLGARRLPSDRVAGIAMLGVAVLLAAGVVTT
jgi:putative Mn2+ efflux pump MntP